MKLKPCPSLWYQGTLALSVAWLGTTDFIAFTCNWIFLRIDLVQWNQWAFPLASTERSSLRGWTVPLAFSTLGWRWKHPDLSSCSPLKDPQRKSLRSLSGSFKCDERSVALQWLAMLRVWGESSTCVSCVLPCFPFPKTPRLYKKGIIAEDPTLCLFHWSLTS